MIDPLIQDALNKFRYDFLDIKSYINSVLTEYIDLKNNQRMSEAFESSPNTFIIYDDPSFPYYFGGEYKGMISDIYFERVDCQPMKLKYTFKSYEHEKTT